MNSTKITSARSTVIKHVDLYNPPQFELLLLRSSTIERNAWVEGQHASHRGRTPAVEVIPLYHVHIRRGVWVFASDAEPLRNATVGHLEPNNCFYLWFHGRTIRPILLRHVLIFGLGRGFLFWCSRYGAEHETHAGNSNERPPNERCEFHIMSSLIVNYSSGKVIRKRSFY